ncbi:hypothetical protein DIPPA_02466 [Diplonema papillatum]|nr:hypothetical protein DIPPA_02466 [Diplonema papillatum]
MPKKAVSFMDPAEEEAGYDEQAGMGDEGMAPEAAQPSGDELDAMKKLEDEWRVTSMRNAQSKITDVLRAVGRRSDERNATRDRQETLSFLTVPLAQAAEADEEGMQADQNDYGEDAGSMIPANFPADPREAMKTFAECLIAMYREKPGDVLTEMAENLRFPDYDETDQHIELPSDGADAPPVDESGEVDPLADLLGPGPEANATRGVSKKSLKREASLAVLARTLSKSGGGAPLGTLAELLVLRQATQAGPDIDRDLGWADAPGPLRKQDYSDVREAWAEYEEEHSDWGKDAADGEGRNAVIPPALEDGEAPSLSAVLRKAQPWVKWLCTLWAICPGNPEDRTEGSRSSTDLYYGVGGGHLTQDTVELHRKISPGDEFWWPLPKTTSVLRRAALNAARGSAGVPTEENPGSLVFAIRKAAGLGKAVSAVSQYPEENAVVLPPFTQYKTTRVALDEGNAFEQGLIFDIQPILPEGLEPGGFISEFLQSVRNDAQTASERLEVPSGVRRTVPELHQGETYTYAEPAVRGPKHVSIPKDTAWQEMLWVVERAEVIADDSAGWVGDYATKPVPRDEPGYVSMPPAANLLMRQPDGYRTGFDWPMTSSAVQPITQFPPYATTPALAQHTPAAIASARRQYRGPQQPSPTHHLHNPSVSPQAAVYQPHSNVVSHPTQSSHRPHPPAVSPALQSHLYPQQQQLPQQQPPSSVRPTIVPEHVSAHAPYSATPSNVLPSGSPPHPSYHARPSQISRQPSEVPNTPPRHGDLPWEGPDARAAMIHQARLNRAPTPEDTFPLHTGSVGLGNGTSYAHPVSLAASSQHPKHPQQQPQSLHEQQRQQQQDFQLHMQQQERQQQQSQGAARRTTPSRNSSGQSNPARSAMIPPGPPSQPGGYRAPVEQLSGPNPTVVSQRSQPQADAGAGGAPFNSHSQLSRQLSRGASHQQPAGSRLAAPGNKPSHPLFNGGMRGPSHPPSNLTSQAFVPPSAANSRPSHPRSQPYPSQYPSGRY